MLVPVRERRLSSRIVFLVVLYLAAFIETWDQLSIGLEYRKKEPYVLSGLLGPVSPLPDKFLIAYLMFYFVYD